MSLFPTKKKPAATKKAGRTDAGWERERQRAAKTSSDKSRSGRDIAADYPEVADPKRKAQGRASLEYFCRTYFPEVFDLPWSADHREVIALIERVVTEGGLYAIAMPRGSGKTSIAERAAIWATINGLRKFVFVVGSDEDKAIDILETIQGEFENNERLAEDFPEVTYPIRRLEGIAHRANGQLFRGQRTHITWTAKELILPTMPGSPASGAVIRVKGIEGGVRGAKASLPDGKNVRPDLVLVDDPQTDQSAKSQSQCAEREKILSGAVLGLAGPGKKIAGIATLTVIEPDDLSDRLLNREKNPQWQGRRTKILISLPTNTELWQTYERIRGDSLRQGNGGREATEFYKANREAMDEGAVAAWPVRFNPDQVSAIQHAIDLKIDRGRAFWAEYQNEPQRKNEVDAELLTADQIAAKVNGKDRGVVPAECSRLTAFVDVQQNALFWAVAGWDDEFTGYVVDYGAFPDQKRSHYRYNDVRRKLKDVLGVKSLEEALRGGLDQLTAQIVEKQWPKEDGSRMKVDRCPIDSGWAPSQDVIYKFCAETAHSAIVMPCKGVGLGASARPFNDFKPKKGERRGLHWRTTLTTDRPIQRRMMVDVNFWKSFVHERLRVGLGGRGCLSLYGDDPKHHQLFAEHLTSEDPIKVEAKGNTVIEWKDRPSKPDNHWFDCIVGCAAAASERGASLAEQRVARVKVEPVRYSQLQRKQ